MLWGFCYYFAKTMINTGYIFSICMRNTSWTLPCKVDIGNYFCEEDCVTIEIITWRNPSKTWKSWTRLLRFLKVYLSIINHPLFSGVSFSLLSVFSLSNNKALFWGFPLIFWEELSEVMLNIDLGWHCSSETKAPAAVWWQWYLRLFRLIWFVIY